MSSNPSLSVPMQLTCIRTLGELRSMINLLRDADNKLIAYDTETTATKWFLGKVFAHCFACKIGEQYYGFYIPVRHHNEDDNCFAEPEEVEDEIRPLLADPEYRKILFNKKFDINFALNHDLIIRNTDDVMLLMFLRNEEEANHKLKDLCERHFGRGSKFEADKVQEHFNRIKNKIIDGVPANYSHIPMSIMWKYGCIDACLTLALWYRFSRFIEPELSKSEDGIRQSIYTLENNFTSLVQKIERRGFPFDTSICDELRPIMVDARDRLAEHIYTLAGRSFDITNSGVADILKEMGFKPFDVSKKTGEPLWGKPELMRLDHDIGECIACFRQLEHNLATFVDGLPKWTYQGRIYCSYNQIGARTGRASASEPNLQQIPKRSAKYSRVPEYATATLKLAFGIRKGFRPTGDFSFLSMDYSQFELRILDHYAQDPAMHKALVEGRDAHTDTAARLFGISYEELERRLTAGDPDAKFMRDVAKECNFAILYGAGIKRLWLTLMEKGVKVTYEQTKQFFWRYKRIYSQVAKFVDEVQSAGRRRGWIFNYYGRHKRLPNPQYSYKLVNHLIQGLTADMIKVGVMKVNELLEEKKARTQVCLMVHDEVDSELHHAEHELIVPMKKAMLDFDWVRCPLEVEVSAGPSWGETKVLHA